MINLNIRPRALTDKEIADKENGEYDSFANYLVFCPKCGHMAKTNMYVMRAEAYIDELKSQNAACPNCGGHDWLLGYPENSSTGFVKF